MPGQVIRCILLIQVVLTQSLLNGQHEDRVDFDSQIRPILSDRCFTCHGPDEADRQADLRLDSRESAIKETQYGEFDFVIKPGEPDNSELLFRLLTDDEDLKMPPPDSHLNVTQEEADLIRKWIQQGATWSEHWAFKKISRIMVPELEQDDWSTGEIDKFVLRRLRAEDLQPKQPATKEVLARRVYLDVTGLPPSIAQLDAFLADESDSAYEELVDEVLASTAYGERMAVEWLDVARYSDTHGYQADFETNAWPYRDWVIEAFNANLPFDDFITWQIAGDLLPGATRDQKLATAFNRLHRQTNEGGSVLEEFRQEYVADRVDTFGIAFLGLSVGCARCHDHKFDPISQQEYYELSAFFDNIDEVGVFSYFTKSTPTPALYLPTDEQSQDLRELQADVNEAQLRLAKAQIQQKSDFEKWLDSARSETNVDDLLERGLIGSFGFEEIGEAEVAAKKKGGKPRKIQIVANRLDEESPGEFHESPTLADGKAGNGLSLSGDNGFTSSVTSELTRFDSLTFSFWIKASQEHERATIIHTTLGATDSGNRGIDLVIVDGKLNATICHFWPGNAIRVRAKSKVPIHQWVNVTFTYDGSSEADGVRLYLDGQRAETEVIRNGLTRTIRHTKRDKVDFGEGNTPHHLTIGYRYRDRGFAQGLIDELKVYDRDLSEPEVVALVTGQEIPLLKKPAGELTNKEKLSLLAVYQALNREQIEDQAKALRQAQIALSNVQEDIESVMVMKELPQSRKTYFLNRGAYDAPGKEVQPGIIAKLLEFDQTLPKNRLGLASWLTDKNNPLTARVAVNRIWQIIIGRGIVGTQEDFGSQGGRPSHPELLDYLASDFVDHGWDVKRLVKQILLSATYQQASECSPELRERDPENELLARGPSRRLTAEMIRDSALASSGLLVSKVGGPPVKPYQPDGLWMESMNKKYQRDPVEGSRRRSLYSFWKRTLPPPAMITFDAANREVCVARREATATPLQALVLLNDPQYIETARAAAEKVMLECEERRDQMGLLYRILTGRKADQRQLELLDKTYEGQFVYFDEDSKRVDEFLAIGDHTPSEQIDRVELAAMTVAAQMVLNLDHFVMKR